MATEPNPEESFPEVSVTSNIRVIPSSHSGRSEDGSTPPSQQIGLWDDFVLEKHPEAHLLLAAYRGLRDDGNLLYCVYIDVCARIVFVFVLCTQFHMPMI